MITHFMVYCFQIINTLKEQIKSCKFPKRNISAINYPKGKNLASNESNKSDRKAVTPLQREWIDVNCCVLINKPIEKILIRYDKMPKDFSLCFDKQELNSTSNQHLPSLNMFQTLNRYLHHQRWIWTTHSGTNSRLTSVSLAKILSVLTK